MATALRKEIHACIDKIPDRRLAILKPLLSELEEQDEWEPVIEPANFWERIKVRWRMRRPEDFVPFE